jgi:hypothetical protein
MVLLDGEIEIESGMSEKRRFRGGDIIFARYLGLGPSNALYGWQT